MSNDFASNSSRSDALQNPGGSPASLGEPGRYTVLRIKQVMAKTGLSRSTVYSRIKAGEFPSSIRLGGATVGWLVRDVDDFIERCIAARGGEH